MNKNTLVGIIGVSLVGGAIVYYMGKNKNKGENKNKNEDEDEDEDIKELEKSQKDLLDYRQVSHLNDDYQKQLEAEKKEKGKEKEKLFERMNSNDSNFSWNSLSDKGGSNMLSRKKRRSKRKSKKSNRSKKGSKFK
jgi:hypothetical protein